MSNGPFEDSKYAADDGTVYGIIVQPETLSLTMGGVANTPQTGDRTGSVLARSSGSRRGYGMFARVGRFRIVTPGSSGLAVGRVITLPLLNGDIYDEFEKPNTGTYNTATIAAVGRSPERKK